MGDFKDLVVYQKAFRLAMDLFHATKTFPSEEKYALANQIRRSSRSVCANLAEAYRRRKYRPHFLSKLSDCETENTETEVWIDFAKECGYFKPETYKDIFDQNDQVGKMIYHMINNPDKFT